MSASLLNRKAVKELALAEAKQQRPFQKLERFSEEAYPKIEAAVRKAVRQLISEQPRCGKTIK
jgi:glucokinase